MHIERESGTDPFSHFKAFVYASRPNADAKKNFIFLNISIMFHYIILF